MEPLLYTVEGLRHIVTTAQLTYGHHVTVLVCGAGVVTNIECHIFNYVYT